MNDFFRKYAHKKIAIFLVAMAFSWMNFLYAEKNGLSYFEDQDGDGLSDAEEIALGTDPTNPDTDGDGYSDWVEVTSGFDPLVAAPGDRLVNPDGNTSSKLDSGTQRNITDTILKNFEEQNQSELEILQQSAESNEELGSLVAEKENKGEKVSLTEKDINSVIEKSLVEAGISDEEMELISDDEVVVLQVPEGVDAEEVLAKEKKQVEEYFVQVAYILTENVGYISGDQDELMNEVFNLVTEVSMEIEESDDSTTKELKNKGEDAFGKIKALEVPYVLKDVHILGLSLFQYLLGQNKNLIFGGDDPAGLSLLIGKLEGSMMEFDELNSEVSGILDQYNIDTFNVDDLVGGAGF